MGSGVKVVRPASDPARGSELRALRTSIGLHRGDVAKLFGWSSTRVLDIEDGRVGLETEEDWRALFKAVRDAGARGR